MFIEKPHVSQCHNHPGMISGNCRVLNVYADFIRLPDLLHVQVVQILQVPLVVALHTWFWTFGVTWCGRLCEFVHVLP